jgi:general secretion pathway protein L
VRYDAQVLGRRDDGQLDVELVAVPGARFDQAVAELGDLASSLAGVDAMDEQGRPLGVNLLPVALRRSRVDPMRRWNVVLVIVAVLALVGAAWQVLDNRAGAAAAFAAQVDEQAARARVVAAQRQRLVDMVEGAQFLVQARASRPTTVEVLDELSRRLPDRTYMEKISIEGDRLLLIGFSPEPSALVGNLEGSDLWNSPALSGALQPDPRTGLDRFSLTATLQGTPAPGSPEQGVADGAGNP